MARLGLVERLAPGDLYHATDHYLPLRDPARAVVTVHDLVFLLRPEPGWGIHRHMARIVPPFLKACRHIIAISEYTKRDLVEHLAIPEEKVTVIPWAVDREFFTPDAPASPDYPTCLQERLPERPPYLLAVGCNMGRKNTPRLLEAYAELAHGGARHHLVLAWTPPESLRARYQENELAERIHFIGKVSEIDLRDLYRHAAAAVYPSLYEGFGLPVLEAMSCGTPVITSPVTSLPEVGGEAVCYVDPEDVASIRNALAAVEDGAQSITRLHEAGLAQAARFSWERCAQQTLAVYESCLGGSS
jgi:glycosyltransferase involved in cell wall biosynthesis